MISAADINPEENGTFTRPDLLAAAIERTRQCHYLAFDLETGWLDTPLRMKQTADEYAKPMDVVRQARPRAILGAYQWPAVRCTKVENDQWVEAAFDCPQVLARLNIITPSIYSKHSIADTACTIQGVGAALSLHKPVYVIWSPRIGGVGELLADDQVSRNLNAARDAVLADDMGRHKISGFIYWNADAELYPNLSAKELAQIAEHFQSIARKVAA